MYLRQVPALVIPEIHTVEDVLESHVAINYCIKEINETSQGEHHVHTSKAICDRPDTVGAEGTLRINIRNLQIMGT